jgi:autotransporter-associated beta strand protein
MITDAGLIDGSSSGKAIDMGGGNNTLTVSGGAASIIGDISGGVGGTNTLSLSIGAGNSFSYGYTVSNFADVEVNGGTTTLSGANTYAGKTRVNSGVLLVANTTGSGTGTGGVEVKAGAMLGGTGSIAGPVTAEPDA